MIWGANPLRERESCVKESFIIYILWPFIWNYNVE
jgi:hypothetical protein